MPVKLYPNANQSNVSLLTPADQQVSIPDDSVTSAPSAQQENLDTTPAQGATSTTE